MNTPNLSMHVSGHHLFVAHPNTRASDALPCFSLLSLLVFVMIVDLVHSFH
jgi:uncharacterized membrane protein